MIEIEDDISVSEQEIETDLNSQFAVIFDNDGVLCDTERMSSQAFEMCLNECGFVLPDGDLLKYAGLTGDGAFELLQTTFGRIPEWDEFWVRKNVIYEQLAERDSIYPVRGAVELLEELTAASVPYAIASSASRRKVLYNLNAAGLMRYFEKAPIVSATEVTAGKPAPDLFLEAAKRLNVPVERCIGIEDSINGLLAISAAQMLPIAVTTTFNRASLEPYTPHVVSDLSELPLQKLMEFAALNGMTYAEGSPRV